jgi:NIPSNAP
MSNASESVETCCPVVELRQYKLKPGALETLVSVFEEHFIEGQERTGMRILGQFRDLSNPNRFVWLRGFSTMEARRQALSDFYSGPVWKEHGPAANETMIDSDNVLLLRPVDAQAGFAFDPRLRPPMSTSSASEESGGVVVATIYPVSPGVSPELVETAANEIQAAFTEARATLLARLVTEHAPNTFPSLPVRADVDAIVWLASYASEEEYRKTTARMMSLPLWKARVEPKLEILRGDASPEALLLQPTRRSLLRHRSASSR